MTSDFDDLPKTNVNGVKSFNITLFQKFMAL